MANKFDHFLQEAKILKKDGISAVNIQQAAAALTNIEKEVFETDYKEITVFDNLAIKDLNDISLTNSQYAATDGRGIASWIDDNRPLNQANTNITMKNQSIRAFGLGYSFNGIQIEQAAKLGISLDATMAITAMRGMLQHIEDVAYYGDDTLGTQGFFNHTEITQQTALNGNWSTASADDILDDINDLFNQAFSDSKQVNFKPNDPTIRLMLPSDLYGRIATDRLPNGDHTIMSFLLNSNPYLSDPNQIIPSAEISANTARIYQKDAMYSRVLIGKMPHFLSPYTMGMKVCVDGIGSTGGFTIIKSDSIRDLTGI